MNIKDVAKKANVSISTVSRVINNTAKVSPEAKERVEKVLKETNYRPNSLARELQQKKTNTIGLLMSALDFDSSSLGESINAITDVLKANGYNIMLANSRLDTDEEFDILRVFQEKRVDGILFFASVFTPRHDELLKNYPIPIVMIGQHYDKFNIPCVIHDDINGARLATKYLIEQGHKDIGFIGCPKRDIAAGVIRKLGYHEILDEYHIPQNKLWEVEGNFTLKSGYLAMKQLYNQCEHLPTGLFITTDLMALGAIKFLSEIGLSVPEDISIIGFDDISVSAYMNPPLTTIHTDKKEIGVVASHLILDILSGKNVSSNKYVVGYELKARNSVKQINELNLINQHK